ncbi:hypothetical protein [Bradyrhizobium macuxiense]|nr:hypothetical protein [Bradyrhizobium macuxiense]
MIAIGMIAIARAVGNMIGAEMIGADHANVGMTSRWRRAAASACRVG